MRSGPARRLVLSFSAALALAVLPALACGGGPFFMLPGESLTGQVVKEPVSDWSFAEEYTFVDLETRPREPYSVELNFFVREGRLYIDPAESRAWYQHIKADPRVRVRFGNKIYPCTAVKVGDPGEIEGFDPERYVYELKSRPVAR